jgi:hypothetical protein
MQLHQGVTEDALRENLSPHGGNIARIIATPHGKRPVWGVCWGDCREALGTLETLCSCLPEL